MTTDLFFVSQSLDIFIPQASMPFSVVYNLWRVGCKLGIPCIVHVRSILSWRHSSSQSRTPVRAHRILRRNIVATRRTAKLLVGLCRRWMGRANSGPLWMLWTVRRGHGRPVHGAHMGRTAELTHRSYWRL